MNLFERLFAPERPVQQAEPVFQGYEVRTIRRPATASRPRPKIRYAALPKAEPLQIRVNDRQKPLDMSAGATAAFLKDETLRPGDIVVTKQGARVFVGKSDGPHTLRDFESVGRSDFIDRQTRLKLAAMMMPVGAVPADAARRTLASVRKVMPVSVAAPVATESVAMRVINPWQVSP